jgi:WD repeat and SOF domain-containing protein 1
MVQTLDVFTVPEQLGFKVPPVNPRLPSHHDYSRISLHSFVNATRGIGPERTYLDLPPNVVYPPRPVPGSVADLDMVMEHCDFSEKKVCFVSYHSYPLK